MTDHADTIRRYIQKSYPPAADQRDGKFPGADANDALTALLAERQQLQEERDAAFDAVGLPRTASLDDLIRHHRNNAGMSASGHKIAAEEWEKLAVKAEAERQQAQEKLWEQSEAAANLVKEVERLEAERQQAQEERDQIARDYEWAWEQRQQAIDALRRIGEEGVLDIFSRRIIRDTLTQLGEQPQP